MLTNTRIAITYLFLVKVRDGRVRFFLHFVSSNVSEGGSSFSTKHYFFQNQKVPLFSKKKNKSDLKSFVYAFFVRFLKRFKSSIHLFFISEKFRLF